MSLRTSESVAPTNKSKSMSIFASKSCRSLYRLDTFDEQFMATNPNMANTSCPPSPTLSEAVSDLQAKLKEIPPLAIHVSPVGSTWQHAKKPLNSHLKHIRSIVSMNFEAGPDSAMQTLCPAPTIPSKSRKRQWRASEQSYAVAERGSLQPLLSPRRRSASDLRVDASEQSHLESSPTLHRRSASDLEIGLPSCASADRPMLPVLNAPSVKHCRTASHNAPESAGLLPLPRLRTPACESRAHSAALSVLVPSFHFDDGLILADELNRPEMAANAASSRSSPRAAELVLLNIMSSLSSLRDLQSTAVINKGMRRVYKQNEIMLLMIVFKNECLPAWELREWSAPQDPEMSASTGGSSRQQYTTETYRSHIRRDASVVQELKYLISERCQTFLRPETVESLATDSGEQVHRLDEAFYRIWCFCKIFGGNKGREEDVAGQLDWLKGGILAHQDSCGATVNANMDFDMSSVLLNPPDHFGACNVGGLSSDQLYDMTELWNCLAALMQPYLGKIPQARSHGVFSTASVRVGDLEKEQIILEEWIFYILSIGPAAVLKLAELSGDVNSGFALARINGWMDWMPPTYNGSRSTFLKEPVARLYEERMISEPIPSRLSPKEQERKELTRKRVANLAQEIRLARCSSTYKRLPLIDMSQERPWSVVTQQTLSRQSSVNSVASVAKHRKPCTSTPPLSSRPNSPFMHSTFAPRKVSPIMEGEVQTFNDAQRRSLDKTQTVGTAMAVQRIVSMGFTVGQAREALKITSLADGLDVTRAVDMLLARRDIVVH